MQIGMGIDRKTARVRWVLLAGTIATFAGAAPAIAQEVAAVPASTVQALGQLSLEELANVEVTAVSRRPQPVSEAPSAVFVITNDDVHRLGAVSIPEALRLAPNLQVARIDASGYGITARGFNHATGTANKMLVMIDGRTVYSPLFSGVFWDAQNILMEDLDRIEVVSGPGGTLWGANAVNGIINIVTRSSADTQGVLVDLREGFVDRSAGLRFGGRMSDNATYRVYALGFERDHSLTRRGNDANDGWQNVQGGFRFDWAEGGDALTLQGDMYHATTEDMAVQFDQGAIGGGNVLARWSRDLSDGSSIRVQAYYDKAWREGTSGVRAEVDTYDVDAQYAFAAGRHDIVVGGGYRVTRDSFDLGVTTTFLVPDSRTLHRENVFAQDAVTLSDTLGFTFGLKLEDNSYTGLEFMPDARLSWQVSDTAFLWAAISRAVRTPARFDRDLFTPGIFIGGPDFESEDVIAYEVGYRGQPLPSLTLSVSAFYNVYDNLRSVEATTPSPVLFPLEIKNGMEGDGYGIEAWGTYAVLPWWRLSAGVSAMHKDLKFKPGSQDVLGIQYAGNDPDYQLLLRSSMNLGSDLTFEVFARHIDNLPTPMVDAYTELNARLGWQVTDSLELAVAGSDLTAPSHQEFASPLSGFPNREVRRSVYVSAVWKS